jgi:large subunit ribosomal protein L23
MDLNVFEIIKGAVISEKATLLNQKLQKLSLKVHPHANKTQIKQAIQQVFSVKVRDVRTLNRKGKTRRDRRGRKLIEGPTTKHAIVTLKEGYTNDLFGHGANPALAREE